MLEVVGLFVAFAHVWQFLIVGVVSCVCRQLCMALETFGSFANKFEHCDDSIVFSCIMRVLYMLVPSLTRSDSAS